MKSASTAALNILAAGQYLKTELYTIIVNNGGTYRYTQAQVPTVVEGNTYGTGLTIKRGTITQKAGLEVQSTSLMLFPQWDSPNAPILIEGVPLLDAVRRGILDNARVQMRKIFLTSWDDTSPGSIFWGDWSVNQAQAGRFSAQLTLHDVTEGLNVAMPRAVIQPGCVHTLFDAGCTLSRLAFTTSGAVTSGTSVLGFNTNLTQVDKYFDQGELTFISGPNNGLSYAVKSYVNSSGRISLIRPAQVAPSPGDAFTIVPSCAKTQDACANANASVGPPFNNKQHFRGFPYVPLPETMYGGAQTAQAPAQAGQGASGVGSAFSGGTARTYQP